MSRLLLSLSLLTTLACHGKTQPPAAAPATTSTVDPTPTPTPAPAPAPITVAAKPPRQVDRREFVEEVEQWQAIHQMRVVPSIRDGEPNGFKIYAVRKNSLWDRMGIKNGDTIIRINDISLTDPDQALRAYQMFKNTRTDEFSITLLRRGKQMTISYRII